MRSFISIYGSLISPKQSKTQVKIKGIFTNTNKQLNRCLKVFALENGEIQFNLINVKLFTFGSTLFKDLATSASKTILIEECLFKFLNLEFESGWNIQSKDLTLIMRKSLFYFKSEYDFTFHYFLKSSNPNLKLIFEDTEFNFDKFNHIFYILQTKNTSIWLSNLKIKNWRFGSCFLFVKNDADSSSLLEQLKINIKNSFFEFNEITTPFIFLSSCYVSLLFESSRLYVTPELNSTIITDQTMVSHSKYNELIFKKVEFLPTRQIFEQIPDKNIGGVPLFEFKGGSRSISIIDSTVNLKWSYNYGFLRAINIQNFLILRCKFVFNIFFNMLSTLILVSSNESSKPVKISIND